MDRVCAGGLLRCALPGGITRARHNANDDHRPPPEKTFTMRHLRLIPFVFALRGMAHAHVGFENDTEIRVFPDQMRVVLRVSIPFAQALLGDGGPLLANEVGQTAAKPVLEKLSAELISITAGGKPVSPLDTDCLFEVQDDVAFILNFPRPSKWPVVVRAEFFPRFGNLETGTMAVFDCTASRFSREVEPLQRSIIDPRSPSLTFSLGFPDIAEGPAASPKPATRSKSPTLKKSMGIFAFFIAIGVIGFLARRSWRDLTPKA
jgi:hypothetical protein